ncbi:mCG144770 [Mus musculus]|nr:mCG144770 [Mus musculus]
MPKNGQGCLRTQKGNSEGVDLIRVTQPTQIMSSGAMGSMRPQDRRAISISSHCESYRHTISTEPQKSTLGASPPTKKL